MLLKMENKINRFTLYQKYNYALRDWHANDIDRTPTKGEPNNVLRLSSRYPGKATVEWEDGFAEEYAFVKGNDSVYRLMFRALNSDSRYGNGNDWDLGRDENGIPIIPYPNRHYADDDTSAERKIIITCTNDVYSFFSDKIRWTGFPVLECDNLTELTIRYTTSIREIPINRITNIKNLKTLVLQSLGSTLQIIPESLFDKTSLTSLTLGGIFNLANTESSNIRMINRLVNLTNLTLRGSGLSEYIKEFNDLPKLTFLDISTSQNNTPSYREVEVINPQLKKLWVYNEVSKTTWDNLSGKGIDKLTEFYVWSSPGVPVKTLPEYIKELRSITLVQFGQSLKTQERADDFVNSFYVSVTQWDNITMSDTAADGLRNQFYGLNVQIYSAVYQGDQRPSGIYRAPDGFEEGNANGNPQTPMEKIYVLTKNYSQVWTVKPESGTLAAKNLISEEYFSDDSVIYGKGETVFNNELKLKDDGSSL